MSWQPPVTKLVSALPAMVPFTSPEQLERRRGVRFALRLGANESPFGPSPRAVQAMTEALCDVAWYGDPESFPLVDNLARQHGVAPDSVVMGCGIDDLLGLTVRIALEPGQTAVTSLGAYPTFNYHVAAYGGRLQTVPYRADYHNDLYGLVAAAVDGQAKLVYLANPDNPTGTVHSYGAIEAAVAKLPEDCLFLLDEAYTEFAPDDAQSPRGLIDPRIIRFRTFSKVHGMAGARIGYAIGSPALMSAFDKVRLHFGLNRVSQAGALASLSDDAFLNGVAEETARGRIDYARLAAQYGWTAIPSATNFVLIDVGSKVRAADLVDRLAEAGVFIRMPGVSPLDRCIRVTVGTADQRAALASALRKVADDLGHRV